MTGVGAQRALIVTAGVLVAGVMAFLGLWQMRVFQDQGTASAAARAAEPPLALLDQVSADGTVGDIYGRQVRFSGTFDSAQQLLVPSRGGFRVLTKLRLADGRVLPVVRGLTASPPAPTPPAGAQDLVGVFLPGEGPRDNIAPMDGSQLTSVQMPVLAQQWRDDLIPGFVTLSPAMAARQGLEAAQVALPSGQGRLRNGGYALQWWVFAACAIGASVKIARDVSGPPAVRQAAAPH